MMFENKWYSDEEMEIKLTQFTGKIDILEVENSNLKQDVKELKKKIDSLEEYIFGIEQEYDVNDPLILELDDHYEWSRPL